MNNVIRFRHQKTQEEIRDEAGAHLACLERGATAEEQAAIECWLAQDPRHRETFLDMAKLWDEMSLLAGLSEDHPLEPRSRWRQTSDGLRRAGLAATLVLAVGLLGWGLRHGLDWRVDPVPAVVVYQSHHETAVGEQSTLSLPDASEIILNTDTVLDVHFTGATRNVFLESGEAFFTVATDRDRPFRVFVGDRLVEVVGTAFLVQHDGVDRARVMVREGRVDFHQVREVQTVQRVLDDITPLVLTEASVSLMAGDVVQIDGDNTDNPVRLQVEQTAMATQLAWTRGMLVFEGESLETVLREMSRYTTMTLEADASIRDIEVQGYFRAGDIDGLLVAMSRNFNIEASRVGAAHIHLHPGEQEIDDTALMEEQESR